jgi:hypothetical protein
MEDPHYPERSYRKRFRIWDTGTRILDIGTCGAEACCGYFGIWLGTISKFPGETKKTRRMERLLPLRL